MRDRHYYGWNVVALTLVFQAVSIGILVYSFALFVVPWLEEFASPRRDIMLCIVALQLGTGVLSPFAGRALDRFSPRFVIILGAIFLSTGLVLVSQVNALWQLILLFATVLPAGMSLSGPLAAQSLVTKWFIKRRGLAIGLSAMGTSIGGFAFPLLNNYLIANLGWRQAVIILAIITISLICPLTWWILRREPPVNSQAQPTATPGDLPSEYRQWTTKEILKSPLFWVPAIAFIPMNAAFGGVQFNLGAYMQDLNYEPGQAAILISLISVSMITGKLFFGSLSDNVDHRRLYWVAVFCLGLSLVMFQGNPTLLQIRIGAFLLGFATGGILPLTGIIISSRFGVASFGRVMGLVSLFLMVGAFGPLLAGWIYDVAGSYDIAFSVLLVLLIPAALTMTRLKPAAPESKSIANVTPAES
jgi:MFS family permease